ncbi:UDP-glucose/GDP-mannose dehydrogenase family protein [Candidatus Uhrbacteria bacterium]|nr:UDP-glucose/GDP-mannose dehydrogenase family protein [Candidatus Uhrbacteria bacterium]
MRIAIIGSGYVGLTAGVGFAHFGNSVVCADIDPAKIEKLARGICPIYELGLEDLLKENLSKGRIRFTTDIKDAVKDAEAVFFAVNTPEGEYGKANLTYLLNAAKTVAPLCATGTLFINKSTAPVGTIEKIRETISKARGDDQFYVATNPEFLKEGTAVEDFLHPDRIVVGVDHPEAEQRLRALYRPLIEDGVPFIATNIATAELTKYAANSMLALRISFINEIADFCELVGADVKQVAHAIGLDKRIGSHFLRAGIGYGGSCFGKDVKALALSGEEHGYEFKIIKALSTVNDLRYRIVITKLQKHLKNLHGARIAVLGLAFKPMTDDVRSAPALRIIHELLDHGARITAYDPVANEPFKKMFSRSGEVTFVTSLHDAARGADALLLLTAWDEFQAMSLKEIRSITTGVLIVDGMNMLERNAAEAAGFTYEGIGR